MHEGDIRSRRRGASSTRPARGLLPPGGAGRRARVGRASRLRRGRERRRDAAGARGRAAARDEGRVQLDRRRDLRRVRRAARDGITRAQPLAPYGVSKLSGEEYLAAYNRLYGASHVSLRFGNVYGPRQDPKGEAGVVAIFMKRLREGGTPRIFGDGTQTRDYVYVGDVVAASSGGGGARRRRAERRHAASRRRCSTCTSGSSASPGVSARSRSSRKPRPGELQRSVLDPSRARTRAGLGTAALTRRGPRRKRGPGSPRRRPVEPERDGFATLSPDGDACPSDGRW